jgi:hypothetical protein
MYIIYSYTCGIEILFIIGFSKYSFIVFYNQTCILQIHIAVTKKFFSNTFKQHMHIILLYMCINITFIYSRIYEGIYCCL